MTDDVSTLSGFLDALWNRLTPTPGTPLPLLAFATTSATGGAVRMVVLREARRSEGTLTVYTNALSSKIAELSVSPGAEFLLWEKETSFQARLKVKVTTRLANADEWARLTDEAKLNYATNPAPGAPLENDEPPTPDISLMRVLTAEIDRIDLLSLAQTPHRRAKYSRDDEFKGRWIAP